MLRKISLLSIALFFTFTFNCLATPNTAGNSNLLKGKIVETMNSGGYTYMNIEDASGKTQWVAIPETTVSQGEKITYHDGMVMQNFTSNTLKRSFDSIVFSSGIAGAEMKSPHGPVAASKMSEKSEDSFAAAIQAESKQGAVETEASSGGSNAAIVPFTEMEIAKLEGPDGYTVEEVFTKAEELNGKKVKVRGKVLKFSPMIMGRNWIHIQDGTGNPMKNEHDLVVTSKSEAKEGSLIIVEGVVAAKKDFGAGYMYDVIIEDASFTEE